jgi:hypothetical protein
MREKAILISYIKHAKTLLQLSLSIHMLRHCSRVISYLLIEINVLCLFSQILHRMLELNMQHSSTLILHHLWVEIELMHNIISLSSTLVRRQQYHNHYYSGILCSI